MQPFKPRLPVIVISRLLLIALPLNLAACAGNLPQPMAESKPLPLKPSVNTPLPQEPYSESVHKKLQAWRERLMATQVMSKLSETLGQ